jgi:hypothetical protein
MRYSHAKRGKKMNWDAMGAISELTGGTDKLKASVV